MKTINITKGTGWNGVRVKTDSKLLRAENDLKVDKTKENERDYVDESWL